MGKIIFGTSGYSYKDWVGPVYPAGTKPADFLGEYTRKFSSVELNFSYYRMPDPEGLEKMAEKTPEGFLFSIKAHQSLTHRMETDWEKTARSYLEALSPLEERGKLGRVLIQFPYRFHYTRENRLYLAELLDILSPAPLAVEFRNREWQRERVYRELRERDASFVVTDNPELKGLPKPDPVITGETGYFRFHGRNKENWWRGNSVSRYDYLYSPEELEPWVNVIIERAMQTAFLLVYFNNHHKGQAVINGLQLREACLERAARLGPEDAVAVL